MGVGIRRWRREQRLPGHAEVAGARNGHGGVRQGAEDQLVEAGADVAIPPQRERVLVFCVTEAGEQVCRTKPPHAWAGSTPSIPQKYLQEGNEQRRGSGRVEVLLVVLVKPAILHNGGMEVKRQHQEGRNESGLFREDCQTRGNKSRDP